MNTKASMVVVGIVCLVIGGASGYGLSKLGTQKGPGQMVQMGPGGASQGQNRRNGGNGRVIGEVQSITDGRITVKTNGNNSKLVLTNSSTAYQKMANGSASDVTVGQQVMITGTQNSDGSTLATAVQIVPEGQGQPGNPPEGAPSASPAQQ